MVTNAIKSNSKNATGMQSVRIRSGSKMKATALLSVINKKKFGRKVRLDEVIELSLGLISDEHITVLQENSMSHADRAEKLRLLYIQRNGPISPDNFIGFVLSAEFQDFMREQNIIQIAPI